ncbi:ATP-binding protein [Dehalococcoidia bacterium]|nr:ATP-binding protein [Dehalococcoidia bacterium]
MDEEGLRVHQMKLVIQRMIPNMTVHWVNGEEIWAESISAFSNAKGGAVIIAVSDSGKVLGVDIGKKTIDINLLR